jgi:flavodoxin
MKKIFVSVCALLFMILMQLNAHNQGARKILIAYFSMSETNRTDNVDAVSGSSIQVVNGKVKGNVQFAVECIQKTVGGGLAISRNNIANSERDIRTWLGRLGMAR